MTAGTARPFTTTDHSGAVPSPLVLASPHSGREYPADFLETLACDAAHIRAIEDAWMDRIAAAVAEPLALPLVAARWGRAYLDLNRAPDEIDPKLVEGAPSRPMTDRIRAGLGIIPRLAARGERITSGRMTYVAARQRIAAVHAPYHAEVARLLRRAKAANGFAMLLDCHSMPPLGGKADVVIGDRHGTSADGEMVDLVVGTLSRHFRVRRNEPYAGGYTTLHHAQPARDIHAVQLEFDRALYMDLDTLMPTERMTKVTEALRDVAERLVHLGPARALPQAAE